MSSAAPPGREQPKDGTSHTTVHSNRHQSWYQNLCRPGDPCPRHEDQDQVYPSPQRLQLQLHFQREYQQRQELQKNCRQEWWQRKSCPLAPPPAPLSYRMPTPAHKYYGGTPVSYHDGLPHQTLPTGNPQPRVSRPPTKNYYQSQDARTMSAENRRRVERDVVDGEREKMIKAAQVIKLDAEKRIRQAKQELVATSDQENIQRLLIQLLKEQDLAQKMKAAQTPQVPQVHQMVPPMQNLPADLQYKLATLLQAYQPSTQQMSASYQRRWQEQIVTYKDMLQEYRQGNFLQSHQKAKRLLQLLLQKEPMSTQARFPAQFYQPQPQQQAVYQQMPNHDCNTSNQPYLRTPQGPSRSRRDPRLNRSSQHYPTPLHNITPRLNQSSCQYSEQDISAEVVYPDNISENSGITHRRNSTPRKQAEDKPTNMAEKAGMSDVARRQQSEQQGDSENVFEEPTDAQGNADSGKASNAAARENDDKHAISKGQSHGWEQLQQRSRRLRRGRGSRSEEETANGEMDGKQKEEKTDTSSKEAKSLSLTQKPEGAINRKDDTAENKETKVPGNGSEQKDPKAQTDSESINACLQGKENQNRTKQSYQPIDNTFQSKNQSDFPNNAEIQPDNIQKGAENSLKKNVCEAADEQPAFTESGKPSQTHIQVVANGNEKNETETEKQERGQGAQNAPTTTVESLKQPPGSLVIEKNAIPDKQQNMNEDSSKKANVSQQMPPNVQPVSAFPHERFHGKNQRQLSEPPPPRNLQPLPRQRPPWRGQTSRVQQPPYYEQHGQRAFRHQPPQRPLRQSSVGSKPHVRPNIHPSSRDSHKEPDARQSETESGSNTELKSSEMLKSSETGASKADLPENAGDKSEGAKASGGSAVKQSGRRSPGNTYVVRNSGQRLSSKPPAGPQQDKAENTKVQGGSSSRSKNTSPKSTASKSPPESASAGKTEVSPSSGKSRRRPRRKPWGKENTDSYKEPAQFNSAPRSNQRYQEGGRDHQQPSWLTPSPKRWTGPKNSQDLQARRRPYQWDDSKSAPVRKWRAVGQQGGAGPTKINPDPVQQKEVENKAGKGKASSPPLTTIPETADCDFKDSQDRDVPEQLLETLVVEKSNEGTEDKDKRSKSLETTPVKEDDDVTTVPHGDFEERSESENKIDFISEVKTSLGTESEALAAGTGLATDKTEGLDPNREVSEDAKNIQHKDDEDLGEKIVKEENAFESSKAEEPHNRKTNGDKTEDGAESQIETALSVCEFENDLSNELKTESQTNQTVQDVQEISDKETESGTAENTGTTGGVSEEKAEKAETLLEHVLAVLGRKAAREAEEEMQDEDGCDDEPPAQLGGECDQGLTKADAVVSAAEVDPEVPDKRDSSASEASDEARQMADNEVNAGPEASNKRDSDGLKALEGDTGVTSITPDLSLPDNVPDNINEKSESPSPDNGGTACGDQDQRTTSTEDCTVASISPAKLVRLEDMEDWQFLEDPDQAKGPSDLSKTRGLQQESVVSDACQEKGSAQELSENAEQSDHGHGSKEESPTSAPEKPSPESGLTNDRKPPNIDEKVLQDNEDEKRLVEFAVAALLSLHDDATFPVADRAEQQKERSGKDHVIDRTRDASLTDCNDNGAKIELKPESYSTADFSSPTRPVVDQAIVEVINNTEVSPINVSTVDTAELTSSEVTSLNKVRSLDTESDTHLSVQVKPLSAMAESVTTKFSIIETPSFPKEALKKVPTSDESVDALSTASDCKPLPTPGASKSQLDEVSVENDTLSPGSDCLTATDASIQILHKSQLISNEKKMTNSAKKKSVSFADLGLDDGQQDRRSKKTGEKIAGSCHTKSPSVDTKRFLWEGGDAQCVQTAAGVCSGCGRWRAMDSCTDAEDCQVLLDKLTAFGIL